MPSKAFASRKSNDPQTDAQAVVQRFSRRLIGLARAHLHGRLQHKVDPEDVVQSAYKSLLVRYGDGALAAEESQRLWSLLTLITVRKCAERAHYYEAECRDLMREAGASRTADSSPAGLETAGREPTPDEAAVLAETLADLLARLHGSEKTIVELSLQGYSTQEISAATGRAERSVRRVRERVREQLEQQSAKAEL